MTKEETISNIKAYLDGDTAVGNIIPLRSILESAIKYLSDPSLLSNLDEAAIDAAQLDMQDRQVMEATNDERLRYSRIFRRGFKAGAEWMAGQGVKLRGRVLPGPRCNLYIESDCFDRGYKGLNYSFSDSNDVDMFVQIRKK